MAAPPPLPPLPMKGSDARLATWLGVLGGVASVVFVLAFWRANYSFLGFFQAIGAMLDFTFGFELIRVNGASLLSVVTQVFLIAAVFAFLTPIAIALGLAVRQPLPLILASGVHAAHFALYLVLLLLEPWFVLTPILSGATAALVGGSAALMHREDKKRLLAGSSASTAQRSESLS